MTLAPDHLADLRRSGLSDETIAALGFEAICPADIPVRGARSAYRLRYFNLDGSRNCFERLKLVPPVQNDQGHTQKYWQRPGTAPSLYLPPLLNWTAVAKSANTELIITEGEKKAAAACQSGLVAAGVGGVWNWSARLTSGERLVLPFLDEFSWTDRSVLMCPDSDAWQPGNEMKILAGFFALAKELQARGANLQFIVLPDLHGSKCGLDDWLLIPGNTSKNIWPSLQRVPLTDSQFLSVTAWWQRWKEKRVMLEAVKILDSDQVTLTEVAGLYTVRASNHSVTLTFDRLEDQRGTTHAEVRIALGETILLDGVDLNLKSDFGQGKLANSLKVYAAAIPWKLLLQKSCAVVLRRYRRGEPPIVLTKDRSVEPFMYAVNPLVPRKKPCILFADGGKGKSTLALAIGMAVSAGDSLAGLSALPGKSLYLDYEDDADVHTRRLHAIQAGHPNLLSAEVQYLRCTEPLWRMTHDLARDIQAGGITFVILDSLMAATGGDSSAEATGKLFAALRVLNVESLCIGHVPKTLGEGQEHPTVYGSVFNTNYARSVWELKTEQEIGEDSSILGLFHRKTNLSRKHAPIGLQVTHNSDGSYVRYEKYDLSQAVELEKALPAATRIQNFLERDGGRYTAKAIAEETRIPLSTVTSTLSRHKGRKWQMFGGSGQETTWSALWPK